jgi:hypothetical protein
VSRLRTRFLDLINHRRTRGRAEGSRFLGRFLNDTPLEGGMLPTLNLRAGNLSAGFIGIRDAVVRVCAPDRQWVSRGAESVWEVES